MFFVTVFEKLCDGADGWVDVGLSRVVGYFELLCDAVNAIESSAADLHEGVYQYAAIEAIPLGMHPDVDERLSYTAVGLFGSLPQIIKIFKTKSVADLSITSWIMWNVSSSSYLLYALLVNPRFELIFTSALDAVFNIIILCQIIYYRSRRKRK